MADQTTTEKDAWDCATAFMQAVELVAEGKADAAVDTLDNYTTHDEQTAARNTWALVSVAPMITAHVMRRHFADQTPPDGMWALGTVDGLRPETSVEPSALAASRAVVQHLNAPLGAGTEAALDVITAHFRQHGPEGLMRVIVEVVRLAAFLWREGAFEVPSDKEKPRG